MGSYRWRSASTPASDYTTMAYPEPGTVVDDIRCAARRIWAVVHTCKGKPFQLCRVGRCWAAIADLSRGAK